MVAAHGILVTTPSAIDAPPTGKCAGCESLYVIHLYVKIAKRRAEDANLVVVRASIDRSEQHVFEKQPTSETGVES
jgi:hypothetical protein